MTAQIVVGGSHSNHGGIRPHASLWLSENDMPLWILLPVDVYGPSEVKRRTWVPTPETILEDGILMALTFGAGAPELLALLPDSLRDPKNPGDGFMSEVDDATRQALYAAARALPNRTKLVITVLHSSSAQRDLRILEQYQQDVEVCPWQFVREYSGWSRETIVRGSLERKPATTQP